MLHNPALELAALCVVLSPFFVTIFCEASGVCSAVANVTVIRSTAAKITWSVPCSAEVEYYELFFKEEGPCSPSPHLIARIYPPSHLLGGLHPFTKYSAFVKTHFDGASDSQSNNINFITSQVPATMGPKDLSTTSSVKSRPVRLEWGGIECSHRNGNITQFVLNITRNQSESWQVLVAGDAEIGGSYVVCGLEVGVRYSITVAGVNSLNQTGIHRQYDDIFITNTSLSNDVGECTSPVHTAPENFVLGPLPDDPARILMASWSPPIIPNSHSIGYTLTCEPLSPSPIERVVTGHFESSRDVDVVNVTLEGLSPSTMYNCSLLANNSVGSGPSSHLTITMEDDALVFQMTFELLALYLCHEWVISYTSAKLEGITEALSSVVLPHCQCQVPTDHFTDGQFLCTSTSNNLIYRATLHGTFANSSSELFDAFQSWAIRENGSASLNVLREPLYVVSIISCDATDCTDGGNRGTIDGDDPTSQLKIVIATTSGAGGILGVGTLIVCLCCCCCYARKYVSPKAAVDPGVWVSPTTADMDVCTKPLPEPKGEEGSTELPNTLPSADLQSEDKGEPAWVEEIYDDRVDTTATGDTVLYAELPHNDRVDTTTNDDTVLYAELPHDDRVDTTANDDTVLYAELPNTLPSADLQSEDKGEPDWVEEIYDDTVGIGNEGKQPGVELVDNPIYDDALCKGTAVDGSQSDCVQSSTTTLDLATGSDSEPIYNETEDVLTVSAVIEKPLQQYPPPIPERPQYPPPIPERQPLCVMPKAEQPLSMDHTHNPPLPHLNIHSAAVTQNEAVLGSACGYREAVTSM